MKLEWSDSLEVDNRYLYFGQISIVRALLNKIKGKRLIYYFGGSDSLLLIACPLGKKWYTVLRHRLKMRIAHLIVSEYWFVSDRLLNEFPWKCNKQMKVVMNHSRYDLSDIKKKKHSGINGLYFFPRNRTDVEFCEWLYGLDIIAWLKNRYAEHVNFIEADNFKDMKDIYPIVDFYIRPVRHDGSPRILEECDTLNIPYYWSSNFKPEFHEICTFIDNILDEKAGIKIETQVWRNKKCHSQ